MYCPACGKKSESDEQFCRTCGKQLVKTGSLPRLTNKDFESPQETDDNPYKTNLAIPLELSKQSLEQKSATTTSTELSSSAENQTPSWSQLPPPEQFKTIEMPAAKAWQLPMPA